jgi:hypothetical protein
VCVCVCVWQSAALQGMGLRPTGTPCSAAAPPADAVRVGSDKARASHQCDDAVERKLCTSLDNQLERESLWTQCRSLVSRDDTESNGKGNDSLCGGESCTRVGLKEVRRG